MEEHRPMNRSFIIAMGIALWSAFALYLGANIAQGELRQTIVAGIAFAGWMVVRRTAWVRGLRELDRRQAVEAAE
jgi:hypothetical protein